MRSIMLVPIIGPCARHDAGFCADGNKEMHRLCLSRRCSLLEGQVTSNILKIQAGEHAR